MILSRGDTESAFADRIRGRVFDCEESATGIKWFRLNIQGDGGSFPYENARGETCISFGFGRNVFEKFPQEGYSDPVGTVPVAGIGTMPPALPTGLSRKRCAYVCRS